MNESQSEAAQKRLANWGFRVQAVDFYESVLEKGKANVEAKGL